MILGKKTLKSCLDRHCISVKMIIALLNLNSLSSCAYIHAFFLGGLLHLKMFCQGFVSLWGEWGLYFSERWSGADFSLCNGKRSLWLGQNTFSISVETCVFSAQKNFFINTAIEYLRQFNSSFQGQRVFFSFPSLLITFFEKGSCQNELYSFSFVALTLHKILF